MPAAAKSKPVPARSNVKTAAIIAALNGYSGAWIVTTEATTPARKIAAVATELMKTVAPKPAATNPMNTRRIVLSTIAVIYTGLCMLALELLAVTLVTLH